MLDKYFCKGYLFYFSPTWRPFKSHLCFICCVFPSSLFPLPKSFTPGPNVFAVPARSILLVSLARWDHVAAVEEDDLGWVQGSVHESQGILKSLEFYGVLVCCLLYNILISLVAWPPWRGGGVNFISACPKPRVYSLRRTYPPPPPWFSISFLYLPCFWVFFSELMVSPWQQLQDCRMQKEIEGGGGGTCGKSSRNLGKRLVLPTSPPPISFLFLPSVPETTTIAGLQDAKRNWRGGVRVENLAKT